MMKKALALGLAGAMLVGMTGVVNAEEYGDNAGEEHTAVEEPAAFLFLPGKVKRVADGKHT